MNSEPAILMVEASSDIDILTWWTGNDLDGRFIMKATHKASGVYVGCEGKRRAKLYKRVLAELDKKLEAEGTL